MSKYYIKNLFRLITITIVLLGPVAGQIAAQTPEPTAKSEPPSLGFHMGQGDAQHMQAVRAAGGRFAVVVFNWANIEPEPNYIYWEQPDAALRAAEFYGVELIARLDQPPAWAVDETNPTPWHLEAYANFVRRVAQRYGTRLAGLIIWNEPNLSLEWHHRPPDAEAYTQMLKAGYAASKAVAPDLPVLLGGLASTEGEGDWAINDLDYLQALYAAGAANYFDVLTAHPYGFGRPPNDPPEKFRPNFRRLELYRQIMANNGDAAKPIWVTEMGWLTQTDDPRHAWRVVTPQQQANFTLQALEYAQTHYPWLERLGLWQLNSAGDPYGYNLWQGAGQKTSPAYEALVGRAANDPPHNSAASPTTRAPQPIPILAPDVTIRLGDRATLHPHWVHLYRGGRNFSPNWQGEFYLTPQQAGQNYHLLLETMQVGQPTNQLIINGAELARLPARSRLNPTSTWNTHRFSLPAELLQAGVNRLTIAVGPRNPARQYLGTHWENMQFRHMRLVPPLQHPSPLFADWQARPAPSGWSETSRLRPGLHGNLWLAGHRPGQLWRGKKNVATGQLSLQNRAGSRPDLIFNDILPLATGQLAATHRGLFWQPAGQPAWQPLPAAPAEHAYTVVRANGQFYAGFEAAGLWQSATLSGPWYPTTLTSTTVVDLLVTRYRLPGRHGPVDRLFATTGSQLFTNNGLDNHWRFLPLPALTGPEMADAGESPADKFNVRLFVAPPGQLVVRNQDRLWQADLAAALAEPSGDLTAQHTSPTWHPFGPERLRGKLLSVLNCCRPGAIVGTNEAGLWQLLPTGAWQRLDANGFFETTDVTELLQLGDTLYAAGELGLFELAGGQNWHKVGGLPAVITDLLVDPAEPDRWLAGTPAGVYRSHDAGQSWAAISPPWSVWDLAFGPQGRLFVGRSHGLAWSDDLAASATNWQVADGMERVDFLRVKPNPANPQQVWSGTWGNNLAVSSDGGQQVAPLHNGLETLSGLDLIWHATPGQVTLATFAGLFRTDDGGQSWFKLPGPLQEQTVYALHQTDDGAIWAGTAGGMWVSRDYGVTWAAVEALPPATVLRVEPLTVPPPSPTLASPPFVRSQSPLVYAPARWLWAGTEGAGLWLSQNNGASWQFAGLPGRTVYSLFFDRQRRLVAATDQGIWQVDVPPFDF